MDPVTTSPPQDLGTYLRNVRVSRALTLRMVEEGTGRTVSNGYLSQIENGTARKPSPHVLWSLSQVYGLDYGDLLVRAGIRVPTGSENASATAIPDFPMDAVVELTASEREELLQYIAFLRSRRQS